MQLITCCLDLQTKALCTHGAHPGLPPQEAPIMIAEKRRLFFSHGADEWHVKSYSSAWVPLVDLHAAATPAPFLENFA